MTLQYAVRVYFLFFMLPEAIVRLCAGLLCLSCVLLSTVGEMVGVTGLGVVGWLVGRHWDPSNGNWYVSLGFFFGHRAIYWNVCKALFLI